MIFPMFSFNNKKSTFSWALYSMLSEEKKSIMSSV